MDSHTPKLFVLFPQDTYPFQKNIKKVLRKAIQTSAILWRLDPNARPGIITERNV